MSMRNWGFWDWMGYSALGVTVLIEALAQAAKTSLADLAATSGLSWLPYAPLALFITATVVLLLRALGVLPGRSAAKGKRVPAGTEQDEPSQTVQGKTFYREKVEIDDKRFLNCTFKNVQLVYNGGPVGMHHCNFIGLTIATDKIELKRLIALQHELGMLAVPVLDENQKPAARNTKGTPNDPIRFSSRE